MGGALCVRYLRQEVAADIGPKLKHVQLQLDNIQTELTLASTTRHAELTVAPQATRTPASQTFTASRATGWRRRSPSPKGRHTW